MHIKVKSIIITLLFLFVAYNPAHATIYFYFDAENCTNGSLLPIPPWNPYYDPRDRGKCNSDATAPNGTKIMQWDVLTTVEANLNSIPFDTVPTAQTTYYFAFFFRFDRINGIDIWPEGAPDVESFDKAAEFRGNGVRWIVNFGERGMGNQDHRFSVFITDGLPLNPQIKVWDSYYQNYNGYSRYNSIQLEYEKWHSIVFKMRWAIDNTGEIGLWVDGIKVLEHNNITTALSPGTFERLGWNGTYAQPAYNIPPQVRKFDAIIFTDTWQDIVDGGYLGSGGDTQAPTVPAGLSAQAISSSQINLSWTASTDNVGVSGYRIYRDGALIDTSATSSYSNTGLSASTTYIYTVSAYDAANNISTQSNSASATTAADTGGNTSSGGDASASGGGGCGFVKDDNGKGPRAKGEGLLFIIMLIISLIVIVVLRRATKINHI